MGAGGYSASSGASSASGPVSGSFLGGGTISFGVGNTGGAGINPLLLIGAAIVVVLLLRK